MNLMEFMTDVEPDFPIAGELRRTESLAAELQSANERNGRVAQDIMLPPNYAEIGHYLQENMAADGFDLVTRYRDRTRARVVSSDLNFQAGADLSCWRIERNWSKNRADIVSPCRNVSSAPCCCRPRRRSRQPNSWTN